MKYKIGDRVEFHKGGIGTVVGVDGSHCIVEWNDHVYRDNPASTTDKKYKNKSISLPVEDMGDKFNPIIRLAKYKKKLPEKSLQIYKKLFWKIYWLSGRTE